MTPLKPTEAEQENLKYWDEIAPIHYKSYNIESLKQGKSAIDEIQQEELYPITNKTLLHLQCHIGTDTLSLARDGAIVTGIDYSKESINVANKLKEELNIPATFLQSNVYDLKDNLEGQFDIVYTSQGALMWLKDIKEWANIVAHYLKPNGIFYIMEIHPLLYTLGDNTKDGLNIKHSYFNQKDPSAWGGEDNEHPDYSAKDFVYKNKTYEWTWNMSDIINALIQSGLEIQLFNEYDKLFYQAFPEMEKDEKGWWILKDYKNTIPYTFTLKATKK